MECYFVIGSSGTANHSAHRTCDKSLWLHTMCRMRTQQNTTKPNDKIFDSNERTNEKKQWFNDQTSTTEKREEKKKLMSFYLSWAIVWFRFCSVMHNDSEQMVTQPMIEQTNKRNERWVKKEAEIRQTTRKKTHEKNANIFICRSVICGLSFHYVIWIAVPMYVHTDHCHGILDEIPFRLFGCVCTLHYGIIACNAIVLCCQRLKTR